MKDHPAIPCGRLAIATALLFVDFCLFSFGMNNLLISIAGVAIGTHGVVVYLVEQRMRKR